MSLGPVSKTALNKRPPPPVHDNILIDGKASRAFIRYLLEITNKDNNLYGELDIIIDFVNRMLTGSGLDENGDYTKPLGTNYIDLTSSLYGAILKIDENTRKNFSFNTINEKIEVDEFQQMTVHGVLDINNELVLSGDLIIEE